MAESLVRLFGPIAGTGSDQTLYTVPGATTVDYRNIHIVNNDAVSAQTLKMSIGADGAGTRIIPAAFAVGPSEIVDLDQHITLLAGDVLHMTANANLTVTGSGVAVS